jgi:hypothetical protein
MTERVVLHVGCPKSGTTYLQRVLRHNHGSLREQGVLVAGRTHVELVHAGFVVRDDNRLKNLPDRAAGAWDRIVTQVREFDGHTAVISYELFAGARRKQARRAIESLVEGSGDVEVHLVVTCRDLGQAVSSAWQERLKFALETPLEEWQPPLPSQGPRAEWGWRTMDPAGVASRWGSSLPPERVHIVTAPRRGAPPRELWDRFAEASGLSHVEVDLSVGPANESLGVKAAEVLRRVNEQDLGPIEGAREQSKWLRDTLAHGVLTGLDDEPMGITDEQLAEAEQRAQEAVEKIRASGWQVHGDLDDVAATRREGRLPGEVPAEELLDVATRTIVALLLELREARTSEGDDEGDSRRGLAVGLGGKGADAALAELTERLAAAEREVQGGRRLHERVAALSDVVSELLLPAQHQDQEALKKALRDYRSDSL